MKTRFKHIEVRPVGENDGLYEVWSNEKHWYCRQVLLGFIVDGRFKLERGYITPKHRRDIAAFLKQLNEAKDEDAV